MTTEQIVEKAIEAARATYARRNPGKMIPPTVEIATLIGTYLLTVRQLAHDACPGCGMCGPTTPGDAA